MEKYKICPSCGEKNSPTSISCAFCDVDLSSIPIIDPNVEVITQESSTESVANPTSDLVRICECGAVNSSQARKCARCGEDISDITPIPQLQLRKSEPRYQLTAVDSKYSYTLPCGSTILGRENAMSDYLSAKLYVGRKHAKLSVEDGELYLEDLNSTNHTYINGVRVSNEKIRLNIGDEIGLGGVAINGVRQSEAAYFIVETTT